MSRVVLSGTESRPRRLARRDIPGDASFSYFEHCDFGDSDLSGTNFRYTDFYHCFGRPNLTDTLDSDVISRYSDWTGAVINPNVHFLIHDWVEEVFRTYGGRTPSTPVYREITKWVADHIHWEYHHSWHNTYDHVIAAGFHRKDVDAACHECLANYPRLANRVKGMIADGPEDKQIPDADFRLSVWTTEYPHIRLEAADLPSDIAPVVKGQDRYLAARALELWLAERFPKFAPYRVTVLQITPAFTAKAISVAALPAVAVPKQNWWNFRSG